MPASTMKPQPAERAPLTLSAITAAALALIDSDGLDRLSMRRLGASLGFEAMALYKHVADKAALLDAVVDAVYEEMGLPDPSKPWADRLRHSAHELRSVAQRHPHLFVKLVTDPPGSAAVLLRVDSILSALRDSGADDDAVVHHFWHFINVTSGALLAESTALARNTDPVFDDTTAEVLAECRALAHFGDQLAACDFELEFERTIETFISIVSI